MEKLWEIFGGKLLLKNIWWKVFSGNLLVGNFDKMGGDKLTWGFGLTVGDELTAREPDF